MYTEDDLRTAVASGVYRVQMLTPSAQDTRRVVLLR